MNIRALGLTPNYTPRNQNRKAVSFSGQTEDKNKSYYTKEDVDVRGCVNAIVGFGLGLISAVGLNEVLYKYDKDVMLKKMDRFQQYIESDDVINDRFEVKDITGDKTPDIILFKKDGSKVIFDMAEGKFKEEVTTLKEIK